MNIHWLEGAAALASLGGEAHLAIALAWVDALGLGDLVDGAQLFGRLSLGQQKLVLLCRACVKSPDLLVLDEPLSGLDAPTTAVVKECLRAWADRGGSVLYTSHLLDVVERVCDRMAILSHGELVALGTLDELREREGKDGTLEQVFRAVTRSEDPAEAAARILG